MDWDESGPSPYQILGLGDEGPNAPPDEIKKVITTGTPLTHACASVTKPLHLQIYRKLAIVKHPDKNRGNPNAGDWEACSSICFKALSQT